MTYTVHQLDEVIEALRGQCMMGIEEVCEAAGIEVTYDLENEISEAVFECEDCGWWCEISEMSEKPQVCTDCVPEDEED